MWSDIPQTFKNFPCSCASSDRSQVLLGRTTESWKQQYTDWQKCVFRHERGFISCSHNDVNAHSEVSCSVSMFACIFPLNSPSSSAFLSQTRSMKTWSWHYRRISQPWRRDSSYRYDTSANLQHSGSGSVGAWCSGDAGLISSFWGAQLHLVWLLNAQSFRKLLRLNTNPAGISIHHYSTRFKIGKHRLK